MVTRAVRLLQLSSHSQQVFAEKSGHNIQFDPPAAADWKLTQDDSFMAFLDMVALDLPKPARVQTPLLILGAERDNMISPREIKATARAYNTRAQILPGVAHNSMLELRWQSVADRILAWPNEQEVADTSAQVAEPARMLPL